MGCGQSTLSFNGLKRKKKKSNSNNNCKKDNQAKKKSSSDIYTNRSSLLGEDIGSAKRRIAIKIRPISGPLQPPLHTSTSQLDFFKMLDEKIANGQDYAVDTDEGVRRTRTMSGSKAFRSQKDKMNNAPQTTVYS